MSYTDSEDALDNPVRTLRIGARTFEISGVSAEDPYLLGLTDGFEPEFERLCDDLVRYDYVCADIGANIGIKTLLLAQYVPHGRVLAIEPAPTVASLLQTNVARAGLPNIAVIKSAIGDCDGTVHFTDASAYGHISRDGIEVPVHRLTSLVTQFHLERLDFVKIDVEGYEFSILRSSIDLLNKFQSLVLLEFNAWTQVALADVNPKEFAEWIFDNFSNVYRIRRETGLGYLERLSDRSPLHFLHTNFVEDRVLTDLLVTNCEGRLAQVPNRLRPEMEKLAAAHKAISIERDAALIERDGALAARDAAEEQLDDLRSENNYKDEVIRRVNNSIVWKVASPFWRLETRRLRKARRAARKPS